MKLYAENKITGEWVELNGADEITFIGETHTVEEIENYFEFGTDVNFEFEVEMSDDFKKF